MTDSAIVPGGRAQQARAATASVLLGASIAAGSVVPWAGLGLAAVAALMAASTSLRVLVTVTAATMLVAPWPLPALAGSAAWLVARWLDPGVQRPRAHRPSLTATQLGLSVLLGLISGGIATAVSRQELEASPLLAPFHRPSLVGLLGLVLVLAVGNAAGEELLWRGALFVEERGARSLRMAAQAISFGVAHYAGIPTGWQGIVLAAAFSLVMLLLRERWGLAAALVAHAAADVVIIGTVLNLAIYPP